ncbi:MAG: hypothetical protein L0191_06020 [Acidobacteria bacterium]|nr:hypothetical protein [Acidobacteriota bacterium]
MTKENGPEPKIFTTNRRKVLFLELAGRAEGASPSEVYRRAVELGDTVTEEAYYNIARRLVHRGLLAPVESDGGTRYKLGAPAESRWLEEDDLSALIDPEYPILAIAIWKESGQQVNEVPEQLWVELRERLRGQRARDLFRLAILSYCEDFHAQISDLAELEKNPTPELSRLRREAENSRRLLLQLAKYGLGLSREAVNVPLSVDVAISEFKHAKAVSYVNAELLERELDARIGPEPFIVDVPAVPPDRDLLIGAVDGSTRGGILSLLGEAGDFTVGYAPMIAINTSIGQVNRSMRLGNRATPVFMRLPERPEDMQRQDNRYTVMAKLLYPDLSDAEYIHSVWNAMDVIESRAVLRLLKRWYVPKPGIEIPAADVVLRDGTVSPQDRDFSHYSELSSYGQIVRDMIDLHWDILKKCREDGQTVAGVVKNAQLSVFAPVVNWFACQVAREKTGQLVSWPLLTMNLMPDQLILTRLLTAGRGKRDQWTRTCVVLRPFHALTNFARVYSGSSSPSSPVLDAYSAAKEAPSQLNEEKKVFWETLFRRENDSYVKMLENVFYGGFFLGAVPRLDIDKSLPRFEFLVPASTRDTDPDLWNSMWAHLGRLIKALQQNKFEVSAEHRLFKSEAKIDVLPSLVIRAHDTVKHWAAELLTRVHEYIGYYLARHVKTKKLRGIRVRPFSRDELELLYSQLKQERELQAGARKETKVLDE